MTTNRWVFLAGLLALTACDGGGGDPDAGAMADSGPVADSGATDDAGPMADAGEDCGCEAGEVCVAGVCVADCGVDAATLAAGLGAGLTPVAAICRPASAWEASGGVVYELAASTEGTVTSLTVSSWTAGPAGAADLAELGTATHDTEDAAGMTFAGGYLALSSDASVRAFGYTELDVSGGVFVLEGRALPTEIDASGNFDAAFFADDTLLVNGLGLAGADAGQGLYAVDVTGGTPAGVNVMTNMGAFSGSVVVTDDYVIAAGVDGDTFAGTAWVVPRAQLASALSGSTAIDVATAAAEVTDPSGASIGSTFRRVGDRLVTLPFGGPITSYAVSWDGTDLTLSDPRELATGETYTDVVEAPSGRTLLAFSGGLLLVE